MLISRIIGASRPGPKRAHAQIIWIASYPKSGNTWLRFLLANLFYGPISSSSHLCEVVPDIHWGVTANHLYGDRVTFMKTRWKYDSKLPFREDTAGAIYIIRNPLHVAVSNLNYMILRQGDQYFQLSESHRHHMRSEYIDNFIRAEGDPQ